MKVLLANYSDRRGGAARAAYRLYHGLLQIGVDVNVLVQTKLGEDAEIIAPLTKLEKAVSLLKPTLDSLPLNFYPNRDRAIYSLGWLPDRLNAKIQKIAPDIINLHWINAGFLQIETLAKLQYPIVWTLHDMWPFTGGCHYSLGCDRYQQKCGACPQLKSQREGDLSRWVWQRKANAWRSLNLTLVAPSQWLARCANSSQLLQNFPIQVIPNGLDLQLYRPILRPFAKQLLGLSSNRFTVLFAALNAISDTRKGYNLLLAALEKLKKIMNQDLLEIVVLGASSAENIAQLGYKTKALGQLQDEISLVLAFNAADVFVAPSIEDNLPNTILEALACGTPCIAFKIGGMRDAIAHQENGYLVEPFNTEQFAYGISWILQDLERYEKLRDRARKTAEIAYDLKHQANRYQELFGTILSH